MGSAESACAIQQVFTYLISEDGETFLQGKLEPVTARHTVPCPVVKVSACYKLTASAERQCNTHCRHVQFPAVRSDHDA